MTAAQQKLIVDALHDRRLEIDARRRLYIQSSGVSHPAVGRAIREIACVDDAIRAVEAISTTDARAAA